MSGSGVGGPSLFGGASGSGDALLNALYGSGPAGSTGQTPVQALQAAEKNQAKEVKRTAAQPEVQHELAAFNQAVKGARTVAQLLNNPAVMKVILTANGMSDQIGYTALATKVLTSNLKDPRSLANRMTDGRWKTLATTYDFAANGLQGIKSAATLATIGNAFAQVTWQKAEDTVTPGLSNALAFRNKASGIKSIDQILGDPILRTVVTTTLGVPQQIAFQPLNAQEQAIGSRIDLKKFQDPKFVESFVQRYLIANSDSAVQAASPDLQTLAIQARGILV